MTMMRCSRCKGFGDKAVAKRRGAKRLRERCQRCNGTGFEPRHEPQERKSSDA